MPRPSPWPIDLAHVRPFRIGDVEVRPASREVARCDRREVLEPLVMQVLVALASAHGEILSRDDLIDACWRGRAVSDDAIQRVISRLRALGRSFDSFQVETITKVGYRLIRPQEEFPPNGPVDPVSTFGRRTLIAGASAVALAGGVGLWLTNRRPSKSPAGVDDLIARARAATREGMPDDMTRAAGLYRMAIERDPDNAEAWGALAAVYRFQWEFSSAEEAAAMAARTRSAGNRALELDPDNGDAQAALAGLLPMFGNWAVVEAELRRVLARHPQKVRVRAARLLADTGRLREALPLAKAAVAADPDVPRAQNFYGRLLQDNGLTAQALQVFDQALARWPRHILLWFSRFYLLAYSGRPQTAISFAADRGSRPIGVPERVFDIATVSAQALATRAPNDIQAAVSRHVANAPSGAALAENAVTFLAAIGRLDEAFDVLGGYYFGRGLKVADGRFGPETATYTPSYNRSCAFLFYAPAAPLRSDPRFAGLLREIGLEDYWRKTGTRPDYRSRA